MCSTGATPRRQRLCWNRGGQSWETPIWDFRLVPDPFPALRPHLSSAIFTPWDATSGCVSSLQLRAQLSKSRCSGEGADTAEEPGQPPAPPPAATPGASLPREDSEAEDDWLTLKAMSESLSSWEPLRDPDGDVLAGLDCRVPETKETP